MCTHIRILTLHYFSYSIYIYIYILHIFTLLLNTTLGEKRLCGFHQLLLSINHYTAPHIFSNSKVLTQAGLKHFFANQVAISNPYVRLDLELLTSVCKRVLEVVECGGLRSKRGAYALSHVPDTYRKNVSRSDFAED